MDRRTAIADAGLALIAREGMRALTHRGVDAQARLPSGSTSYYVRTRRALLELLIDRIAARAREGVAPGDVPTRLTPKVLAGWLAGLVDGLVGQPDVQAARFALLFELRNDPEVRRELTDEAQIRVAMRQEARVLLARLGATHPAAQAGDLVALVDAVVLYRVSGAGALDARAVFEAYLRGLVPADGIRR